MNDTRNRLGYLNEDFRLFHLTTTEGAPFSLHYHDFFKILIFLKGKSDYLIEGRTYHLMPGDVVLIERGELHKPQPDPSLPYERVILYLSPAFLEHNSSEEASLSSCFSTAAYRHSHVLRIKEELRRPLFSLLFRLEDSVRHEKSAFAGALYSRLLCLEFLVSLNRISLSSSAQYLTNSALDYRISGLLSYINDHLSEELSIPLLSKVCCLSSYHMMRLFKSETGCTIGNYITEKRLLKARTLLSQGKSATEACYESGFQNYSTFLRAYKRRYQGLPKKEKEPSERFI